MNFLGWLYLAILIGSLALFVPNFVFESSHPEYLFIIGAVGLWRYGVGFVHYFRGLLFSFYVFPKHKQQASQLMQERQEQGSKPHIYLMVTSFRIDAKTTADVYRSILEEATHCGYPCTIVASIVEQSDEFLLRNLWLRFCDSQRVGLKIVRIKGSGKRDGLANGFRAIARDTPHEDDLVAVIDGDTVLEPEVVQRCVPFFSLFPNVGALTTNEYCIVEGSPLMSNWHRLRFIQRHINMCSMGLAKKVLTLTGRMSMFRASIVTEQEFIDDVESDYLDHWRLGRFKFLTGDDKSSWYSLIKQGWDTYYVPDAFIKTIEHPPEKSFVKSAYQLMFRWYGNSLRQNYRATKLGAGRLGLLTYYVLWDQRFSMWTSLLGLSASIIAAFKYSVIYLVIYLLWIMITRTLMTLMMVPFGHKISPTFPIILYFNQIFGALLKIFVFFRLDKQSWTRQKTSLASKQNTFQSSFNVISGRLMRFSSFSIFFLIVTLMV